MIEQPDTYRVVIFELCGHLKPRLEMEQVYEERDDRPAREAVERALKLLKEAAP